MASEALRIDIFCRVVDNFGDIGVSWRLARQWAWEQGAQVRLFVDQLSPAVVLVPEVDAAKEPQVIDGVQWRRWNDDLSARCDADLVIEAFAC